MADAISSLEARLASLESNGFKLNPATANPAPLGLYGFALTTSLLMGYKCDLVGENNAQAYGQIMGFAMFFGGLAQFVAGVFEYQRRNTFGFVAFCCYGAFWMSVSFFTNVFQSVGKGATPNSTVPGTYAFNNNTMDYHHVDYYGASGTTYVPQYGAQMSAMWHSMWGILTFLLWLCTFNLTVVSSLLFLTLAILFFLLAAADMHGPGTTLMHGAGGFGFFVAFIAFYDGTAVLMKEMYGREVLPVFPLKPIHGIAAGQLGAFGTKKLVNGVDKV